MWGLQSIAVALAVALGQANPDTTLQGGLEALNCPFFRNGDAAAAAVANLSSSSFLLRFARSSSFAFFSFSFSFSSVLRCLLLLPQLALSLLLLLLPLFIGFPLWLGSLRIRHLLDF